MDSGDRDRRSEILGAAFEEFASRGFRAATIKGIARAAGLRSPALIYWYFPDKEALFGEVLAAQIPVFRAVSDPDRMMNLPPDEVLRRVGGAYLSSESIQMKSQLQLTIGEAIRNPDVAKVFVRNGPGRVLAFLETYLQSQVENGRLRPHDAKISARSFIGMLVPRLAGNLFLPTLNEDDINDEAYLEACIEIFLGGLSPEQREE